MLANEITVRYLRALVSNEQCSWWLTVRSRAAGRANSEHTNGGHVEFNLLVKSGRIIAKNLPIPSNLAYNFCTLPTLFNCLCILRALATDLNS